MNHLDLESNERKHAVRADLAVAGMSCQSCATAIDTGLASLPGVLAVAVSVLDGRVEATYDDRDASPDTLLHRLHDLGFEATVRSLTKLDPPKRLRVAIGGMTCSSCSGAVESALAALPGVHHAVVSLTLQEAKIEYDGDVVDAPAILAAIADAGFEGRSLGSGDSAAVMLEVEGMACASCSSTVEAVALGVPGVLQASAAHLTGRMEVTFDPDRTGPRSVIEALAAAGYGANMEPEAGSDGSALRAKEKRFWWRKFALSLIFSIPLFILNMILMMIPATKHGLMTDVGLVTLGEVLSFCLATPVQFWVGWTFHRGAYRALKRGRPNMDVLVSVGTNAAYLYSILSIVWGSINEGMVSGIAYFLIERVSIPNMVAL
jgi:P-type Cu+ transporter